MENIVKKYKNQEVFIVGALDSIGVPYTMDNVLHKSFIELLVDELQKNNIKLKYCNLCSLGRNKTWKLEKIINKNYKIGDYIKLNKKASQIVFSGQRKEEGWNFPVNPNFLKEFYKIPSYSNLYITSTLKECENPVFLYTCGGMNIRSYLKIKTEMTSKDALNVSKEVLLRARKHIIQTKQDVDHCLSLISSLNPNMQIYVLGVYALLDNQTIRNLVTPIVYWYNSQLKDILKKHPNAHYVDIFDVKNYVVEKDMHPTYEGQKNITKQLIKVMDKECELNNNFKNK